MVDIRKTFQEKGSYAERIAFEFPADKKPLILSFDDVVYASKNKGKGMSDKIIVTDNGQLAAYTEKHTPQIHGEEFVSILEEFIVKHLEKERLEFRLPFLCAWTYEKILDRTYVIRYKKMENRSRTLGR